MFVGNKNFIETFARALSNPGVYAVVGPSQSGKTTICEQIFNDAGLSSVKIPSDIDSIHAICRVMEPHRDALTISSFFCPKPKVIFLDDFDMYGSDKAIQRYVLNFAKHKNFASSALRVVLVVSYANEKSFKDILLKKIQVFRVHNPCPEDAFRHVHDVRPNVDKDRLMKLCREMQGNIGGILCKLEFIEQLDSRSLVIKDRTIYDMLHMIFQGRFGGEESDLLYTYNTRLVSMLYFDNSNKYEKDCRARRMLASKLADLHVLDEGLFGKHEGAEFMVEHLLGRLLCSQPPFQQALANTGGSYNHTRILARTANRCNLDKRIHKALSNIGVDQGCREVLFDVLSDAVLTKGKHVLDDDTYGLVREYLQTIGGIKKAYLDKFEVMMMAEA